MKIAIHVTWGMFQLPAEMQDDLLVEFGDDDFFSEKGQLRMRSHPRVIEWVESGQAGDHYRVVDVPDGTPVYIDDYDGRESVHAVHAVWA